MKSSKNTTNYSFDIQKLYLEMFMSDASTFIRCQNIFEPENFDRKLQDAAEFINEYVNEYKVMPEAQIVNASFGIDLQPKPVPEENYTWLMDNFESFSRHKGLERAIMKSADLLEKGDYGPVEKMIKDAVQISLTKDMGTDYFADPRARLDSLRQSNGQISTGWTALDRKIYGGFNRGELEIFCASSGGGKSLFLANLGCNWAKAGYNVVYITLELSEQLVAMRMDSMMTDIPTKEVFRNLDDVELKVKMLGKNSGSIQIKYVPSGKTVNDLRAYLKEYQVKKGFKPDIILLDYLDLLMPASVKVPAGDLFTKDKYVSEELRNLAMETNTVLATASQLNRCLSLDTKIVANGQEIEIRNVSVGDKVKSHSGEVEVTEVLPITKQMVYEITTKSGKKIKVSANHKFPTVNGLKTLETGLAVGDKLIIKVDK